MRHITAALLAVLVLSSCAPVVTDAASTPAPEATETSSQMPEPDTAVAALIISGDGLYTENAAGTELESVRFADGDLALEAFISAAVGTQSSSQFEDMHCIVPQTVYSWDVVDGNPGIALRVPSLPEPPVLNTFVLAVRSTVNGVSIRTSTGIAVGDDITGIPETLPAEQTVGLHESVIEGGSPDPTTFVYDPVGVIEADGQTRSYGGSITAEAGIAAAIYSPRPSNRLGC